MILERIHLAIVQAVEQHGSLTAAAERLCVTQSALSHSVRKLEERLGTALWLRQGRSAWLLPRPAFCTRRGSSAWASLSISTSSICQAPIKPAPVVCCKKAHSPS